MGHERYRAGDEIIGERPADELARRMLATGKIAAVHIHGSMVTAELVHDVSAAGSGSGGEEASEMAAVISDLYTYYVPGVEIPPDSELIAMVEG